LSKSWQLQTNARQRPGNKRARRRNAHRGGKSQQKGDLNFAYARIFVEREAVLGAFNYSEIRQATNVSQHKVEAFYQLENNIQLGFTGCFGRPLVTAASTTLENTLKRLQFDITYKF